MFNFNRGYFTEGKYTHEDPDAIEAAHKELVKMLGGRVTLRNKNVITIGYNQPSEEEVAIPIVEKHGLRRLSRHNSE